MNNVLLPTLVSIFFAQSSLKAFSSWSEKKKQTCDTNVDIKCSFEINQQAPLGSNLCTNDNT